MPPDQLEYFAWAVIKLAFAAGVAGAIFWQGCVGLTAWVSARYLAWEEKHLRVIQARARARARCNG